MNVFEAVKLKLSPAMERYLKEHQRSFMPEDTLATRILNFLDGYGGKMVCSLQIYHEGLGHPDYEEPKQYDIHLCFYVLAGNFVTDSV